MNTTTEEKTTSVKAKEISVRDVLNALIKYNAPFILLLLIIVSSIISPVFLSWRNITTVPAAAGSVPDNSTGRHADDHDGRHRPVGRGCCRLLQCLCCHPDNAVGLDSVGMLFVAIALTLAMGCAFGALNGLLIGKLRMAPFIITLAMMSVAQGVTYIISGGAQFRMKDEFPAARHLTGLPPTGTPYCICRLPYIL